jgi:hypothetical protein
MLSLAGTAAAQTVRYDRTDRPRARWAVSARPLLEIGGASGVGSAEFTHVVGVTRLTDRSLVVADAASKEIRHFSPDGRFIKLLSRHGKGPGELNELDEMVGAADSLVAFEGREAVHVFTTQGWIRTTRRPTLAQHIVQRPHAILAPDIVLWWLRRGDEKAIVATGDSQLIGRIEGRDPTVRLLAGVPLPPSYGLPGRRAIYPLGFAPSAHLTARDNRMCLGYSATYEFRCLDGAGRTLLHVVREVQQRNVSASARAAFRRATSGLRSDGSSRFEGSLRAHRERVAAAAEFSDHYPAYSQLLLASGGELWVRDYVMEDGLSSSRWRANPTPSRWSVFSQTGEWLAEVTLPPRFAPAEIGTDYIVGVSSDEDDVQRVTLWALLHR